MLLGVVGMRNFRSGCSGRQRWYSHLSRIGRLRVVLNWRKHGWQELRASMKELGIVSAVEQKKLRDSALYTLAGLTPEAQLQSKNIKPRKLLRRNTESHQQLQDNLFTACGFRVFGGLMPLPASSV